ncbi:MAG: M3 family oligoendopeptidase, partial [Candidatus Kapabacteria bacterium]|nr:M3 family oligoendopeptidase [Candidatus Kapabacteria bacterium]
MTTSQFPNQYLYTSMATPTTFGDLQYVRPDIDHLRAQMESMVTAFHAHPSVDETIALIRHWNTMRTHIGTMQSLAEVKFTQNVKDDDAKREKQFLDEQGPTITELFMLVQKEILASPHRDAIASVFGELFVIRLEEGDKVFRPEIKDLLVEEAELCTKYNDITASAKIEVDGKTYNLSTIAALSISPDRDTRKKASTAVYDFLADNKEAIESIYDRLVHLRDEKARKLGYADYIDFRYIEFGRNDYNRHDVAVFRDQVREHVVPLVSSLRAAQAKRLGIDSVRLYDEKLHFADGNPIAKGDHDWIVDRARTMYAELSPETHEFFELMLQGGLMDLKSRDNKATGGYCTSFAEFGLPFIFANFNQTTHDIEVLTHEAGHAFQAYRSRNFEQPEYRWPTMEACEIHSMGMEFLTWPWMESFFGEQINKFRFYHLQGAL